LVRDLNRVYTANSSLWEVDSEPAGFQWIDANNAWENIVSFIRRSPKTGHEFVCVGNFSPVVREHHRLGLPKKGEYRLMINSDLEIYGGSGVVVPTSITAEEIPVRGWQYSASVTLPPLATLWFEAL
jgi:1,4-alpha-glucan branching enzyme